MTPGLPGQHRGEPDGKESREGEHDRRDLGRRPELQRRHLAHRPDRSRPAHEGTPEDQAGPGAAGQVVGEELGCQPVDRVRRSGADRNQRGGWAADPCEQVRDERHDPHHDERRREPTSAGVVRLAGRSRPGEQGDARDHRADACNLALPDRLTEQPHAVAEQDDQARREGWLYERQRDQRERSHLQRPARQREPRAQKPYRPSQQPGQERCPERVLPRNLPRLQGLQRQRRRVQDGCSERGYQACEDEH